MARLSEPSPYIEFDRKQWRTLRKSTPLVLTEDELIGLRGLGEQIDLAAVTEFRRTQETADLALEGRDVPRLVVPELNEIPSTTITGKTR